MIHDSKPSNLPHVPYRSDQHKDVKAAEVAEKVNTLKTNVDNLTNSLTVTE